MTTFTVLEPGFFTTVQDLGRVGWRRFGLCTSGAMDQESHVLANWLAGNPPDQATLEITATGPKLSFNHDGFLALCGADMAPCLNNHEIPIGQTLAYHEGDVLSFQGQRNGFRSYLALWGGIDTPPVMGSRSTNIRAGIGGLNGRALATGDRIPVGEAQKACALRTLPDHFRRHASNPARVRIMPGPEISRFNSQALIALLSSPYRVSEQSDRMGMRLEGRPLHPSGGADILSAGIPMGTIQVPGNGQPIITLADGQPTGGYARLATVFSPELSVLAQVRPGQFIRFSEISFTDAVKEFKLRQKRYHHLTAVKLY